MRHNILVIGAGQIGSRHLQGLARSSLSFDIDVVDPSQSSLDTARSRFEEVPGSKASGHAVSYATALRPGAEYDLAVVATSSGPRAALTRELLEACRVGRIVFEKVLFSRLEEYHAVGDLLREKAVAAWVNCPRRMYPLYRELLPEFGGPLQIMLQGGMWGLACNCIHFVDLASFLAGEHDFSWDVSGLDPLVHESSRQGYMEFSGTLAVSTDKGTRLVLHAQAGSRAPMAMSILGRDCSAVIGESHGKGWLCRAEQGWKSESIEFRLPFQSELSHLIAEQILGMGRCDLPSFEDSAKLHLGMVDAFQRHLLALGRDPKQLLIT